jgi:hypothetical protein
MIVQPFEKALTLSPFEKLERGFYREGLAPLSAGRSPWGIDVSL